jgi:hypothetical protein
MNRTRTPLAPPASLARLARLGASFGTLVLASATSGQTTPAAPASSAPPLATPIGAYRLPLVREGSVLSRVEGDLAQDPDEKLWLFRPIQPEPGGLRREFALLPSPVLEDMLRTVRLAPTPVEFEMTGRVFIYGGRNFLLAELAPPIARFDAASEEEALEPASDRAVDAPSGEAKFVPPVGDADDAAVEELERRLEERIGRAPVQPIPDNRPRGDEPAARREPPVASGTRLVRRAGRLARDPQSGAWRFVPTQSTGRGDGSLELMPCLMLERLERDAREGDASPEILLSGTVYGYEGRSYLLPSGFRRAPAARGIGS